MSRYTAIAALCASLIGAPAFAESPSVALSQIVEHPALDATRQGIVDGLAAQGYVQGETLDFTWQSAQGDIATATQIARQFVGEDHDVLIGVATPTAQALVAATRDIPIVFTAVTDPVGAKLLDDMAAPSGNVTGLSDMSPVRQHVMMMREILPDAKTIGVVYNPGEANSVSLLEALKAAAPDSEFTIAEAAATNSAEVQSATQAVVGKADVVYAMTDNTVASAIDALIAAANAAGKPVFGGETSYVEAGAIAALGFDYYQVGVQTADYVAAILDGAKPADLPARVATGSDLFINPEAAAKVKVGFPESMMENATLIVGESAEDAAARAANAAQDAAKAARAAAEAAQKAMEAAQRAAKAAESAAAK